MVAPLTTVAAVRSETARKALAAVRLADAVGRAMGLLCAAGVALTRAVRAEKR
jgi:hypothetical protein